MPLIPDLTSPQGTYNPATPDIRTAMEPGMAVARVGNQVEQIANAVGDREIAARDNGVKNLARLEMQRAYDDQRQFREENPDETTWGAHAQQSSAAAWDRISKNPMSGSMKTELETTFKGWSDSNAADTKFLATKQTFATSRQRTSNAMEAYIQAGDFTGAHSVLAESPNYSAVEKEKIALGLNSAQKDYARGEGVRQAVNAAASDPEWLNKHPVGQDLPGLDSVATSTVRRTVMTAAAQTADEFANTIEDLIAGGKVTNEQIQEMGKDHVRPAVIAQLTASNDRRQKAGYDALMRTPEAQAQVAGKARALMLSYDPTAEGTFDSQRTEILGLVRTLPEGSAIRSELESNLGALKSGKQEEIKTQAQSAQKALDDYWTRTVRDKLPTGDSGMPAQTAIDQRLLQDWSKLKELGFSVKQADPIIKAKTDAAREQLFRDSWAQRENPNAKPDAFLAATAQAIVLHQPQVKFSTPGDASTATEARAQAELRFGAMKTELAQWLKVNPTASAPEIDAKVLKLTGGQQHSDVLHGLTAPRPIRSGPEAWNAYSRGPGNVVTPATEATVRSNAAPFLNDPSFNLDHAPLGMRNNNPLNIIYVSEADAKNYGAVGASSNVDAGSTGGPAAGHYKQKVFDTPAAGMDAGARLVLKKYRSGMTTAAQLIAGDNGWTGGNHEAAANVAHTLGLKPGDDLNLTDPAALTRFLKALAFQEHGSSARQYKDSLFSDSAQFALK